MMRIVAEALKLPMTALVYGMEMLARTMEGLQKIADRSIDVMIGEVAQTRGDAPESESEPGNENTISLAEPANGTSNETTIEEEPRMSNMDDKDLSGDDLKLVRYKVLFIKRDHEFAFPEREDLVSVDIDETGFTAWKIAEFIQRLDETPVPDKWRSKGYPSSGTETYIRRLPEDDKQYLRVFYQVLDRFPREEASYEADQIKVLEQIRDELARRPPAPVTAASPPPAAAGEESGRQKRG